MSKYKDILKLISDSSVGLSVETIAESLRCGEKLVRTYVNRMRRNHDILEQGRNVDNWKLYIKNSGETMPVDERPEITAMMKNPETTDLLTFLYQFFQENFDAISGNKKALEYIMKEEKKFNRIEELIKHA